MSKRQKNSTKGIMETSLDNYGALTEHFRSSKEPTYDLRALSAYYKKHGVPDNGLDAETLKKFEIA